MMKAFAVFLQVAILAFRIMGNHFHQLARVPERPEAFDLPLERVKELWQGSVGEAWIKGRERQCEIYRHNGSEAEIEDWRQETPGRMFSLSAFTKSLKPRFSTWYNRRNGRAGAGRSTSGTQN